MLDYKPPALADALESSGVLMDSAEVLEDGKTFITSASDLKYFVEFIESLGKGKVVVNMSVTEKEEDEFHF